MRGTGAKNGRKRVKKATKAKAVFSAEQEAAIRRMIAAGIDGAVNGKIPFPLQLAQRYLERICPPMIEKIIQAEKGGLTRDIRKELEAQGEQIMPFSAWAALIRSNKK